MVRRVKRQKGGRPLLEEIEGRVLYSADGLGGLDAGLLAGADDSVVEASLLPTGRDGTGAAQQQAAAPAIHDRVARHEVVFIDATVPDHQQLIDDLSGDAASRRGVEVVLLDADEDGIAQISHALDRYGGLDAVHIVSHGEEGALQLGDTVLELTTLQERSEEVRGWGAALSETADVLIYGCDLAASDAGRAVVDTFSELTGADVAASDDLTGAAILGGDWDLEYRSGDIETILAFGAEVQQSWSGVLVNDAPTLAGANDLTGSTRIR